MDSLFTESRDFSLFISDLDDLNLNELTLEPSKIFLDGRDSLL